MTSIVVSLITGVVLSLAFPKANLHWVAWFALAPLMYYVYPLSWKRALICGLAFGMGYFGALVYWIAVFGKLPWVVLAVFQSVFIVGFVAAAKSIGGRMGLWSRFLLLPALWLTFEWIRSLGMFGFTWGDLGYSQYKALPVLQIASITGVSGISFLLALSNAALSNLMTARRLRMGHGAAHAQVFLVLLLVAGTLVYGFASLGSRDTDIGRPIRAAVVQGDVNQDTKIDWKFIERTWSAYTSMTLDAGKRGADLIVWPETVVPGHVRRDLYVRTRLSSLAALAHAQLLVGGWDEDDQGRAYNSVFLIGPEPVVLGQYSKVHLVPFGEFVPGRKYMPFLKYYRVTAYDTSPGRGHNTIKADSCRVGTSICFESIFPEISRRMTASGADLLCVITNDCWYDWTAAAEQHMAFSVLRAVENRRWLVRGASTGISCIIDPHGRIVARSEVRRPAVVASDVRARTDRTFYTTHGDWPLRLSHSLILLLLLPRIRPKPGRTNKTARRISP